MKNKLVILGAGGHAKVIIECAELLGYREIILFDDYQQGEVLEYKIIGTTKMALSYKNTHGFIVAIGDNRKRQEIFDQFKKSGCRFVNLIHPTATISKYVSFGEGNVVLANSVINAEVFIGDNNIINTGAIVEHDCLMGSHNHIAPGSILLGGVEIKNYCFCGSNSTVKEGQFICDHVTIGAGAFIRKNINQKGIYYEAK